MNSERRHYWLSTALACASVVAVTGALVAQQNTVLPQPNASRLPAPTTASPKPSRGGTKPEGINPSVPAGFTLSTYAELPSPRMSIEFQNTGVLL